MKENIIDMGFIKYEYVCHYRSGSIGQVIGKMNKFVLKQNV